MSEPIDFTKDEPTGEFDSEIVRRESWPVSGVAELELSVDVGRIEVHLDRADELRKLFADRFATRTQAEWVEVFEGTDACVAAVIPIREARDHPHMKAREVYVERDGLLQPAPAPRFSRTAPTLTSPPSPEAGAHTREALTAWGIPDVDDLLESGVAVQT